MKAISLWSIRAAMPVVFPSAAAASVATANVASTLSSAYEEVPLKVIKKDNSRELFDPVKLRSGLEKACYKRPVSHDQIENLVRQVESDLYANYFGEVLASVVGDLAMGLPEETGSGRLRPFRFGVPRVPGCQ